MTTATPTRHWLDKATPSYWTPRDSWRVRAMRQGKPYQWVLKAGRADPSSTGLALASAEFAKIKAQIVEAEKPKEFYESVQLTDEQENRQQLQSQYEDSGFADRLSFDEWKQIVLSLDFSKNQPKYEAQVDAVLDGLPVDQLNEPTVKTLAPASKPFSEFIEIYKADLDNRLANTKPGMRTKRDISKLRVVQYKIALKHLSAAVGHIVCKPLGKYHLEEETLSSILAKYRTLCVKESEKLGHSGHWVNERMKTARALTTFLAEGRLVNQLPPNIATLTEQYQIDANPLPIPLNVLASLWQAADAEYRGFMLLALNCGFRQSEIGLLERKHIRTIAGQVCIEKRRGKTGVPLAIPLWKSTVAFIEKYANKKGRLFAHDSQGGITQNLTWRLITIRDRAAKELPEAADYSFQNFRDTGASYMDTINPMLTPLYLANGDQRMAKYYAGEIKDGKGEAVIPMNLASALEKFETYLNLPKYSPKG